MTPQERGEILDAINQANGELEPILRRLKMSRVELRNKMMDVAGYVAPIDLHKLERDLGIKRMEGSNPKSGTTDYEKHRRWQIILGNWKDRGKAARLIGVQKTSIDTWIAKWRGWALEHGYTVPAKAFRGVRGPYRPRAGKVTVRELAHGLENESTEINLWPPRNETERGLANLPEMRPQVEATDFTDITIQAAHLMMDMIERNDKRHSDILEQLNNLVATLVTHLNVQEQGRVWERKE